jgi:hypothetical protein
MSLITQPAFSGFLHGSGEGGGAGEPAVMPTTNLENDFEAASLDASLNDGDAITTWANNVSGGVTCGQATAASKPIFKESAANGRAAARFDGINDFLTVGSGTVRSAFTLFFVFKLATAVNSMLASRGTDYVFPYYLSGVPTVNTYLGSQYTDFSMSSFTANFCSLVLTYDGTTLKCYQNGNLISSSVQAAVWEFQTIGHLNLVNWLNGDIARFGNYTSALVDTPLNQLNDFLEEHYSL